MFGNACCTWATIACNWSETGGDLYGAQPDGVPFGGEIFITMQTPVPGRHDAVAVDVVVVGVNGIGFGFQCRDAAADSIVSNIV